MTTRKVSKHDLSDGFKVHRFDPIAEVNRVTAINYRLLGQWMRLLVKGGLGHA